MSHYRLFEPDLGGITLRARRLARTAVSTLLVIGLTLGAAAVTIPAHAAPGGEVTGWGANTFGQTGAPAPPAGVTYTAVAAGGNTSFGLRSDGVIVGWGADVAGHTNAPALPAGVTYTAIDAGHDHAIALRSDGTVISWGDNTWGQTNVPAAPAGVTYTAVAAGLYHSLALRSDGTVISWGDNAWGQTNVPAAPAGVTYTAIAAGDYHSLALRSDGTAAGWGDDTAGQADVPAAPVGVTYTAVAAGVYHSLALRSDGTVISWGNNAWGQTNVPAAPAGVTYTAIAAGDYHSLALRSDGTAAGWGDNSFQQVVIPAELTDQVVTAIDGGGLHSLAIATDFAADGDPVVSGVPGLGGTLTVTPGDYNAQPDSFDYQWYADGDPVGTSSPTYQPGVDDVGDTITVTVTAHLANRPDVETTSAPTAPVTASTFSTIPNPTITGTAMVGEVLTADAGTHVPTRDSVTYAWSADGAPIGGGPTLTLAAAQLGKQITVTATATKAGFIDAVSTSAAVGPVTAPPVTVGLFTTVPTPTLAGTARAGQTLTADPGTYVPAADTLTYRWAADGTLIEGATTSSLALTPAQVGTRITVTVTADKLGYATAVTTSSPVGPVAPGAAPTVELSAAKSTLRRGRSTELTWTSTDATRLVATGAWAGELPSAGTQRVKADRLGIRTYEITATNAHGTTTATVQIRVTRPAARLAVTATPVRNGVVKVTTRGLGPREAFTIQIGDRVLLVGVARRTGPTVRRVTIPDGIQPGRRTITVMGDQPDRIGRDRFRAVR